MCFCCFFEFSYSGVDLAGPSSSDSGLGRTQPCWSCTQKRQYHLWQIQQKHVNPFRSGPYSKPLHFARMVFVSTEIVAGIVLVMWTCELHRRNNSKVKKSDWMQGLSNKGIKVMTGSRTVGSQIRVSLHKHFHRAANQFPGVTYKSTVIHKFSKVKLKLMLQCPFSQPAELTNDGGPFLSKPCWGTSMLKLQAIMIQCVAGHKTARSTDSKQKPFELDDCTNAPPTSMFMLTKMSLSSRFMPKWAL